MVNSGHERRTPTANSTLASVFFEQKKTERQAANRYA